MTAIVSRKGSLLHTITNDDGHFSKPNGIAALDGILYVTDVSHYSVVKMTTSGEFLSKFGTEQLSSPRGICLSYDGRIFIASEGNNRVSVFEPDGTFTYHITGSTVDNSNLRSPWGVAFDSSGDLHVANHGSNDVFVFTPEGEYKTKYSCGISELAGIAISADGYSFVAKNSSSDSRLFIFNYLHQKVYSIEGFVYARGVAIDKDGFVYVAGYKQNTVYKY